VPSSNAPTIGNGLLIGPSFRLDDVNEPQTEAEVKRLRESVQRGRPFWEAKGGGKGDRHVYF
jgi:hypothetical protein